MFVDTCVCTTYKVIGIIAKKESMSNKECLNYHRIKGTNMGAKCKIFVKFT